MRAQSRDTTFLEETSAQDGATFASMRPGAQTPEELETLLQNVLDEGHKHLIVCLTQVSHIDSGGVRALVRGFQTAQRLGGSLVLACVDRHVHHILEIMRLDVVLHCYESVDAAIAGSPAST